MQCKNAMQLKSMCKDQMQKQTNMIAPNRFSSSSVFEAKENEEQRRPNAKVRGPVHHDSESDYVLKFRDAIPTVSHCQTCNSRSTKYGHQGSSIVPAISGSSILKRCRCSGAASRTRSGCNCCWSGHSCNSSIHNSDARNHTFRTTR